MPVFTGKNVVEICQKHLHEQPEPLSDAQGAAVDQDLAALVLKCLDKSPARWPQSARDLS